MSDPFANEKPKILRISAIARVSIRFPYRLDLQGKPAGFTLDVGQFYDLDADDVLELDNTIRNLLKAGLITTLMIGFPYQASDVGYDANGVIISLQDYLSTTTVTPNVINVKNSDAGLGEFTDPSAALDSITDASVTNPYLVNCGPGVFVCDTLRMKPYVVLRGAGDEITIIQVNATSKNVVEGADFSAIRGCMLTGATDSGKAGVYHNSATGTTRTAFWVEQVKLGSNNILVHVQGNNTGQSSVFVNSCKFGDDQPFVTGFLANTTGSNPGKITIRNTTTTGLSLTTPDDVVVADGVNCEIVMNGVQIRAGTAVSPGNCIRVRNGAILRLVALNIKNFHRAIWIENVGAPVLIRAVALLNEGNDFDLQVDQITASGCYQACAALSKIINLSPDVSLLFSDIDTGDIVSSGVLRLGTITSEIVDVSTLVVESGTMGVMQGGMITDGSGLTVHVASGFGYLEIEPSDLRRFDWLNQDFVLPANTTSYIYFDSNGVLTSDPSAPTTTDNILLGRVATDGSGVIFIDASPMGAEHTSNLYDSFHRDALGSVYAHGSLTTQFGVRGLSVTAGNYFLSGNEFSPSGGNPIVWEAFHQNGLGGYTHFTQSIVDNANYDNGTTLVPLTAGFYAKPALYLVGDGANERYLLVYPQAQYSAQTLAEQANIPSPPSSFVEGVVLIAAPIVKAGQAALVEILDIRPVIGFKAGGVAATSFHSNLLGLVAPADDHTQYLHIDGRRAMTGDLSLGTHNLTNIGTANGVVIENHHARHQPGSGTDELPTAAAVSLTPDLANAVGTSTSLARADHVHTIPTAVAANEDANSTSTQGVASSFSRSDHTHAIASGVVSSQTPDQANAAGTSANFARADHIHNIPTAVAVGENANSTNTQGVATSFSRSDHTHAIASGSPVALTPDQPNSAGTSANLIRSDHVHNIPTAVASSEDTNSTNTQGVAASFARSDHTHAIASGAPITQTPDQANAAGSSANFAKADHIHNIPTAVAVGENANSTNTQGSAASFSRSDHTHAIATGAPVTLTPDQPNTTGSSANLSRADHIHDIPTAAPPTSLSSTTTNDQGVAASFARSDHSHAILTGAPVTLTPDQANSAGSSASLSKADHVHTIPTAIAVGLDANSVNAVGAAASFSRSNHTHAIASGTPVTQTPDQANSAGTSANFARADHIHDIPAATPVTVGLANSKGVAASFSLSDHVHAHGSQTDGTLHAAATGSVNGFMSSSDKTKLDASTDASTPSTLVSRDASGRSHFAAIFFDGSVSGNISFSAPSTVTSYGIVWPASQGAAGTFPSNDGAGNLTWTNPNVNIDGGTPGSVYTAGQFINGGSP